MSGRVGEWVGGWMGVSGRVCVSEWVGGLVGMWKSTVEQRGELVSE